MSKWLRAKYLPCMPLGDNRSMITASEAHIQLSRAAAAEGAVLLKNNHSLLPLAKGTRVAVFGKGQIDYVKGGGGSGDVYTPYVRNIYQGLKMKADHLEVFDALSLYYQEYVSEQYRLGYQLGMFDEAPLPTELLERAREFADTAIIVINRYSREEIDRRNDGQDDYFNLSCAEAAMVEAVTQKFQRVVVLLNVGAMIDTSWFAYNDAIASAVMLWQGGMEGGLAAADILTGEANPSGKLVDTCARSFDDYPSSAGFHESEDYVKYTEDIYVGYRYFETIPGKKDRVVYPFGYGLSYTNFVLSDTNAACVGNEICVSVTVRNAGKASGKEVVQVYYGGPDGKLDKPTRELAGFAKTQLLQPGEHQRIVIRFAVRDMASFDNLGVISKSAYVLEKGSYPIYVGTDVRNAVRLEYAYEQDETVVVEQLHPYGAPERLDQRLRADGSIQHLECGAVTRATFPLEYVPAVAPEDLKQLEDVATGDIDLDAFMAQLTDDELIHLVSGKPNRGVAHTRGLGDLPRLGIPAVMTTDGPAGIRVEFASGVRTTAFPVASCLAATWNLELVEMVGRAGALEAKENNLLIWLTPALNIHRSPLCGRNFEYYSEDPFVAGKMASAMVRGIQSQNIVAVPKHYACNNKETNRKNSDSIVSERALREIYLKGFEICVKESAPKMIMTSYNVINGVRASENAELIQGVLRQEWGYQGMITSDWDTLADPVQEVKAGNDLKMPVGFPDQLKQALHDGRLTRAELYVCAKRILELMLWIE